MAVTINASTSSGVITTADNSGALQLQTNNGTTAMTIDTSQNVGIGTASPSAILQVNSTAATVRPIVTATTGYTDWVVANTGGNIYFGIDNSTGGVSGTAYGRHIYSDGAYPLDFFTNSTQRMRIDSSGNLGVGGTAPAGVRIYSAGSNTPFEALNSAGTNQFDIVYSTAQIVSFETYHGSGSNFIFKTAPSGGSVSERLRINDTGGLILAGSTAQKATGTTWSNPSDQRLKENIRDYTKGTTELMQVRVREWEYNGKGNTTEGMKGLGVVADEVMTVLPDTVETYNAKLNADDEEDTEIKKFDATEITWLLVKTVQEQQTIITELKSRIEALEGAK